jgi:hypothetical protein
MKLVQSKGDEKDKGFDEWEIKNAYEAFTKVEEIKKNPKLLKEVQKYAESAKRAITSIEQLKAKGKEMAMEDEDGED